MIPCASVERIVPLSAMMRLSDGMRGVSMIDMEPRSVASYAKKPLRVAVPLPSNTRAKLPFWNEALKIDERGRRRMMPSEGGRETDEMMAPSLIVLSCIPRIFSNSPSRSASCKVSVEFTRTVPCWKSLRHTPSRMIEGVDRVARYGKPDGLPRYASYSSYHQS